MDKIRFLFYYIKLRVTTALGFHKTFRPLDMQWRWEHWEGIKESRRKQVRETIRSVGN